MSLVLEGDIRTVGHHMSIVICLLSFLNNPPIVWPRIFGISILCHGSLLTKFLWETFGTLAINLTIGIANMDHVLGDNSMKLWFKGCIWKVCPDPMLKVCHRSDFIFSLKENE